MAAKAATAAMRAKPAAAGIGMTMGTSAPMTHTSWKRVSNLANDRPRLASGASRWLSLP